MSWAQNELKHSKLPKNKLINQPKQEQQKRGQRHPINTNTAKSKKEGFDRRRQPPPVPNMGPWQETTVLGHRFSEIQCSFMLQMNLGTLCMWVFFEPITGQHCVAEGRERVNLSTGMVHHPVLLLYVLRHSAPLQQANPVCHCLGQLSHDHHSVAAI